MGQELVTHSRWSIVTDTVGLMKECMQYLTFPRSTADFCCFLFVHAWRIHPPTALCKQSKREPDAFHPADKKNRWVSFKDKLSLPTEGTARDPTKTDQLTLVYI